MRRRKFITLLGGTAAWPLVANLQQTNERWIGVLRAITEDDPEARARAKMRMREIIVPILVSLVVLSTPFSTYGTSLKAQTLIDQSAALAGGITPSDAPGFPITIDTPGSYRLVGNLDVIDNPTMAEPRHGRKQCNARP